MSGYIPAVGEDPVPDRIVDTNLLGTIFQEMANGAVEILGAIVAENSYVIVSTDSKERSTTGLNQIPTKQ